MVKISKEIPERDKPFFLSLISAGILSGSIIATVLGGYWGNTELIEAGKHCIEISMILATMAWTYYFKTKG